MPPAPTLAPCRICAKRVICSTASLDADGTTICLRCKRLRIVPVTCPTCQGAGLVTALEVRPAA